jgi:transcriptional regulator with XRE-family HTH domain
MENLNRIKAVLAETGHTGKWLADQLGKDPVTISKWCTNTSQPDLSTLFKISKILNVDVSVLLVTAKSNQLLGHL